MIGCGFIGRHAAAEALRRAVKTTVLTTSPPGVALAEELDGVRWVIGDAGVPAVLGTAMEEVDHVLWCAGGLLPSSSVRDPWTDATRALRPLLATLDALRDFPGVTFSYLSSGGTVYGVPTRLPIPEDHGCEPITPYGVTKLAAEKYIGMHVRLHGLRAHILRCGNVYGEHQPADRGQGAVAAFLDCALNGRPVVLFGDGSVTRDYIHVADTVQVMFDLLSCDEVPPVLNVGSGVGTSLAELLDVVREETGWTMPIDRLPARSFDVPQVVLDISRLRALIDVRPRDLRSGIRQVWSAQLGTEDRAETTSALEVAAG